MKSKILLAIIFFCFVVQAQNSTAEEDLEIREQELISTIETDPHNEEAYYELAFLYYSDNYNIFKAEDVLKEGLKYSPDSYLLNYGLGHLGSFQNNFYGIDEYFEKAIAKNPTLLSANIELGYAYFQNREYRKAYNQFKKVKELDPQNGLAECVHGVLFSTYVAWPKWAVLASRLLSFLALSAIVFFISRWFWGSTESAIIRAIIAIFCVGFILFIFPQQLIFGGSEGINDLIKQEERLSIESRVVGVRYIREPNDLTPSIRQEWQDYLQSTYPNSVNGLVF